MRPLIAERDRKRRIREGKTWKDCLTIRRRNPAAARFIEREGERENKRS